MAWREARMSTAKVVTGSVTEYSEPCLRVWFGGIAERCSVRDKAHDIFYLLTYSLTCLLTCVKHRDTHRVQKDAEPREQHHARVVFCVALDRIVRTKEALTVVEVLTRKGAEGRRAHYGREDECKQQQPRQGREQHLLWPPAAEPADVSREDGLGVRVREEAEQDGRREDDGREHGEGEVVFVAAKAEALQGKPQRGNIDVEHAKYIKELSHLGRELDLVDLADARHDLME
eukprot:scaffold23012_cov75-Phaeocystis_antarctica.AAC.2